MLVQRGQFNGGEMADIAEDARKSLERIQEFDTTRLPRLEDLGKDLNFSAVVEPANRIINLFRQFPSQYLQELPDGRQRDIKNQADSFFNHLTQIEKFDPKTPDAFAQRNALIQSARDQYEGYFNALAPQIAYGSSRLRDYSALEREARSAIQASKDQADQITKQLESSKEEIDRILADTRKAAAEQGVTQQAAYFKSESDLHNSEAEKWRSITVWTAIGLVGYSAASIALHKIPWLTPTDNYAAFQLAASKVLIFIVIAYMLVLSARNFLSHKHNEIVNRHRQNALLTFQALVDAAGQKEAQDVVLSYASACIFAPQETGYTKTTGAMPEVPSNIIQSVPKLAAGGSH